jgi:serine/threonine-protein kinase
MRSEDLIGRTISHYKITATIGAGGMGEVYLAEDIQLDRKVAVKILPSELAQDRERMSRFVREAKAASAIDHPNIVHVYEIGEDDNLHFIAMQYVEGETLRRKINEKPLSIDEFLQYAIQLTDAITEAHARGITHRDLKPANIMISGKGHVKLLDFGIARIEKTAPTQEISGFETMSHTKKGAVIGTIAYMSPEQALGKNLDHRTDIFSMGILFYEMITGKHPFSGNNPSETIDKIIHSHPDAISRLNYSVPQELERIIRKCLEKDPANRYQSASEILVDLRNLTRDLNSNEVRIENTSVIPKISTIVGAVLAILIVASVFYFYARPKKAIDSLAILPFANTGGDPNIEYVSDGITESLINNLSQLPKLRVMARTTVFTYKGKQIDPRKVGQELKVQAVLTGKLTQVGDTLIIQGELVNTADGSQLWGEQYNRKFSDILTVQGTIAKEIAERLRYKITGEQEKLLTKRYTENTEAYQLYLKGRYFWNQRTPASLQKSMEFYQQAINKDPNYALAYAGMADSYVALPSINDADPKECYPKAKIAVAKALELDDTLVEAHATMMFIKSHYDWDWAGVEKEYRRAVELNPNYPVTHATYGGYLNKLKRPTEGIVELKRALELDPLSRASNMLLGRAYFLARQNDQAIDQLRKTLEIDPDFLPARTHLAMAYIQKKMYSQAIEELSKGGERARQYDELLTLIGYIYAVTGQRVEALKVVDQLKERSKQRYVSPYFIAIVYAGLREKDQTFEWLQKAYDDRSFRISYVAVQPEFDNIRSDPRYADLIRKLNLPS